MDTTVGDSRKKRLPSIVIIVLVIVLAGGAGIGLRWWQNRDKGSSQAQQEPPPVPDAVDNVRDLLSAGQADQAGDAVAQALSSGSLSNEEKYLLYIEQGLIAIEKGDNQAAVDAYTKAWETKQTFEIARRLGSTWQLVGNNEKALEFYKKALELNSKSNPTYESDKMKLEQMIDMLEGGGQ